jgi:protein-S-isoprenylcysteine O-methyltransferase Ste14
VQRVGVKIREYNLESFGLCDPYSGTEATMDWYLPQWWINALWLLFALYWLITALKRKRTKRRETILQRSAYVLPLLVAVFLMWKPQAHYGRLGERFLPYAPGVEWTGVALTAAGVGIALWARWHLGANWSGSVTLKEGHELIRSGPYRAIRHPIYTGILLAMLGTAVWVGEVRALLGVAIAWLSFYIKARREESFLAEEFGSSFTEHSRHTGMFLPRIT